LSDKNAYSPNNSHPGREFSGKMASVFSQFIIDVVEGNAE